LLVVLPGIVPSTLARMQSGHKTLTAERSNRRPQPQMTKKGSVSVTTATDVSRCSNLQKSL